MPDRHPNPLVDCDPQSAWTMFIQLSILAEIIWETYEPHFLRFAGLPPNLYNDDAENVNADGFEEPPHGFDDDPIAF